MDGSLNKRAIALLNPDFPPSRKVSLPARCLRVASQRWSEISGRSGGSFKVSKCSESLQFSPSLVSLSDTAGTFLSHLRHRRSTVVTKEVKKTAE
ncbi:hypothetical protein G9A89_015277 [Geosiphon pyriformis]|nr:hypothetical protein G9A89_015277 [Geosiphon pyriformis]